MPDASHPSVCSADWHTLVLGIGNLLWADEGFGVRCVEALNERYELPPTACVMDGGTQGIFLLPWVRSARRLLIFDAVDFALVPGTLERITGDDVPRYMGAKKVSMHQAGFQEVLASAQLAGEFPAEICLIGVQPQRLDDYGGSLTPLVKSRIAPALDLAVETLAQWGVAATPRETAITPADSIGPQPLNMPAYEGGRPCLDRRDT